MEVQQPAMVDGRGVLQQQMHPGVEDVSKSLDFVFRVFQVVVGLWFTWADSLCGGPAVRALNKQADNVAKPTSAAYVPISSCGCRCCSNMPPCVSAPSVCASQSGHLCRYFLGRLVSSDQAGMVLLGLSEGLRLLHRGGCSIDVYASVSRGC